MNFKIENYNVSVLINNYKENMPVFVLNSYESIIDNLKENSSYILVEVSNINWNKDMTPWKYEEFSGNADNYLSKLLNKIIPKVNEYIASKNITITYYALVGYSLAGLFSMYVASKNTIFTRFGGISSSLWYKDFTEYFKKFNYDNKKFYMSLGKDEKKSKNKVLRSVEENTLEIYKYLGDKAYFEFNPGGHFNNSNERILKCIKYLTEN